MNDNVQHGCTIPGTDGGQVDTATNQAGLWSVAPLNIVIGNRMANHFNGMFYDFGGGRGAVSGQLCTNKQLLGRLDGNTFHGHLRFGSYILGYTPKQIEQDVALDGLYPPQMTKDEWCQSTDENGHDRGMHTMSQANVDYGSVFTYTYTLTLLYQIGRAS